MAVSNEEFVRGMYRSILGRVPENGGLEFWTNMLDTGIWNWDQALRTFVDSDEAKRAIETTITDAYMRNFGRRPDTEGLAWYKSQIASGVLYPSADGLDAIMRQSPEFEAAPDSRPGRTIVTPAPGAVGTGTDADPYSMPDSDTSPTTDGIIAKSMTKYIKDILDRYDLPQLESWVIGLMEREDQITDDMIQLELYETDEFKKRFPGIEMQRQDGGTNVMSPEEYLQYETRFREIMRQGGIPEEFYDQKSDFTTLIANRISPSELQERVNGVFTRIQQAPPEVRAQYASWFGPSGDAALAMSMLDPDKALPVLEKQMRMSEIGGFGNVFGFDTQRTTAQRLADLGLAGRDTISTYSQLQDQRALFNESVTETEDLDVNTQGVDAAFGLDTDAADTIERRRATRTGNLSGGGGLMVEQTGIAGRAE